MKKKSDLELGINGMIWMSIMTISTYLIQLVITYFLARKLSPTDYGEVASITVLVGFAELFWMMGVGPGIVQKKDISDKDIITGQTLNIIFGIIIFLMINIFAEIWVNLFSISNTLMLRVFSIIFILKSISGVSQSLMQKKCRFKEISIINFITLVCYALSSLIFAFMNMKSWSLVFSKVIEAIILMIILLKIEPMPFKLRIYSKSFRELMYFGGGFTIAKIFNYIANNGDYFIVNKTMGSIYLGAYTKAYQLLMYPVNLIGSTLDQVLFPLLSKSQNDKKKLKRVFISGTGFISLISVPISIVAYSCAEDLVLFFLGDQWENTVLPFKILIIGLFFRIAYKLSDSLIRALGKVYQRAIIQIIYAIMIIMSAYIGHFYGLAGVSLGVSLSIIINYLFMTMLSMKFIKIGILELLYSILPSLVYGVITFKVLSVFESIGLNTSHNLINCVFVTIIVFSIYTVLFIISRKKFICSDLNNMINSIFKKTIYKNKQKKEEKVYVKYQ